MSDKKNTKEQEAAQDVIAQCYKDGSMEINSRKYVFLKTTHKKRLSIYSYMTSIAPQIAAGNFSFFDSQEWDRIESILSDMITIDDMVISKLPEHWEKYPQDYLLFTTTAMQVISHPFLAGNPTD